jgi:hypothetical protein
MGLTMAWAVTPLAPPGAHGTITVIGLSGYLASDTAAKSKQQLKTTARPTKHWRTRQDFMGRPPFFLVSHAISRRPFVAEREFPGDPCLPELGSLAH